MRKLGLRLHFRSKLMLVQCFLVLPLITIVLFVFAYMIRMSVMAELDKSRAYSLQMVGGAFDRSYTRALKILEIPYTDRTIYNAVSSEYGPGDTLKKNADFTQIQSVLYRAILYYEPNITSVTIVSEISGATFYSRTPPTTALNMHNPDWYDPTQSAWYRAAVVVDDPVISPAAENELYLGSGTTLSLIHRLKDVMRDRLIGAVRVDLNLSTMYRDWHSVVEHESDVFVVLDHTGRLVFASSPTFLEEFPLLTTMDVSLWQGDYHTSNYTAPDSGFSFFYLAHPLSMRFNAQLLYGIPLLFAACSLIYSVLFIGLSSQHISRPVRKLKAAMLQGQQKDLTARCEYLDGEMGELSEAFNDLMDQVGVLVAEVAEREQEKAQLAYEMLQSKINPHFLYNTMNAIRWKAEMLGMREISRALESLASLLRFSIKSTRDIIPFTQELEQLENYIQIMRVRYGGEVDVCYDIDDRCEAYQCLKFLFQPAVENCFIHAFGGNMDRPKNILVQVAVEGTQISAVVEDNGGGMSREQIETLFNGSGDESKTVFVGIGIGNVKQRIKALFGPDYSLEIESEPGVFTRVIAIIPKIKVEEAYDDTVSG